MADGLLLLHATHTFPQYQCEKVNMITGRGPENTFLLPNCPTCSTFFWHGKTFPSVTPYWIKTNACSRYLHAQSVNPLSEMLLEPVTPPRWQDYGLRFHTDSGRKDESQGHLSCLWVVLSLRGKCVLWHLATSSWIISAFLRGHRIYHRFCPNTLWCHTKQDLWVCSRRAATGSLCRAEKLIINILLRARLC